MSCSQTLCLLQICYLSFLPQRAGLIALNTHQCSRHCTGLFLSDFIISLTFPPLILFGLECKLCVTALRCWFPYTHTFVNCLYSEISLNILLQVYQQFPVGTLTDKDGQQLNLRILETHIEEIPKRIGGKRSRLMTYAWKSLADK